MPKSRRTTDAKPESPAHRRIVMAEVGAILAVVFGLSFAAVPQLRQYVDAGRAETAARDVARMAQEIESACAAPEAAALAADTAILIVAGTVDPWDRSYGTAVRNGRLVVFSSGPDGVAGNGDDVTATVGTRRP